jgi:hypothetical protein
MLRARHSLSLEIGWLNLLVRLEASAGTRDMPPMRLVIDANHDGISQIDDERR